MYRKVLVLGGTGFLGQNLKAKRPDWVYIGSKECDLKNSFACEDLFKSVRPDAIIHLAGKVGGIKENTLKQAEYYYENVIINTNVINEAKKAGIKRVLSALSTCIFPEKHEKYPFSEEDILQGPPPTSNLSYGFSKRALLIQSNAYREQYGLNYSCFSLSNIYGPHDNFSSDRSHFVAAMIKKIYNAKEGDVVEFWGTGRPMRQQLYVADASEIISTLLEKHNTSVPIIVAPNENLTIKEMINTCIKVSGKNIKPVFNNYFTGQFRKDGSNRKLLDLIGNYKFVTFQEGLKKTYEWYTR